MVTAAEGAQGGGRPQRGRTVPPQGVPQEAPVPPSGRPARQGDENHQHALPALPSSPSPAPEGGWDDGGSEESRPQQSSQTRAPLSRRRLSSPVGGGPGGPFRLPRTVPLRPRRRERVPPSRSLPPTRTGPRPWRPAPLSLPTLPSHPVRRVCPVRRPTYRPRAITP
ncbi:hypothetical protein NKH18_26600 [Streptomyces sp. M10(2022)]